MLNGPVNQAVKHQRTTDAGDEHHGEIACALPGIAHVGAGQPMKQLRADHDADRPVQQKQRDTNAPCAAVKVSDRSGCEHKAIANRAAIKSKGNHFKAHSAPTGRLIRPPPTVQD